jgi:hypothetical protein
VSPAFAKSAGASQDAGPTSASTTLVTLTESEGAGEHTHAGGLGRAHQTMFDWLDTTLTA